MSAPSIGFMVAIGYFVMGLLCARIWWNINTKTRSYGYLTIDDGSPSLAIFIGWPIWIGFHICRVVVLTIFKLADLLTKLIRVY